MEDEEEEISQGWLVSYADLMTLLFAAFVVLYGLKPEGETTKIFGILSSIREAFVEIPDKIPDMERKGPIRDGTALFKYFKGEKVNPPVLQMYKRAENVLNVINRDMEQVKRLIDLKTKHKSKTTGAAVNQNAMSVHRDADGFKIRLVGSHFFEPGSHTIKRDAIPRLNQLGKVLYDLKRKFIISGHTDATKGKMDNWLLSSMRALEVGKYLMNESMIPSHYVLFAGYGDSSPVGNNATREGRKLNRRVEIKVMYQDEIEVQE